MSYSHPLKKLVNKLSASQLRPFDSKAKNPTGDAPNTEVISLPVYGESKVTGNDESGCSKEIPSAKVNHKPKPSPKPSIKRSKAFLEVRGSVISCGSCLDDYTPMKSYDEARLQHQISTEEDYEDMDSKPVEEIKQAYLSK